jgi:hypothetical protein
MKKVPGRAAAGIIGLLFFLGTAEAGEVAQRSAGPGGGTVENGGAEAARGPDPCGRNDGPVTIIDVVERRVVTIDLRKGTREERRFTNLGNAARESFETSAGRSSGPGRNGAPTPRPAEAARSGEAAPAPPDGDGSVSYCRDGHFRVIVGGKAARETWFSGKAALEKDVAKVRKEIGKLLDKVSREDGGDK